MSWLTDLAEVYDNCTSEIGVVHGDLPVLLPIAHSTQNAQIEITLDENGNFRRARTVEKDETVTVIPVSENSGGRTGGVFPHPLCDKLEYIAGDYCEYFTYAMLSQKNDQKAQIKLEKTFADFNNKYNVYLEQLLSWVQSPFSCPQIEAIYKYTAKKSMMRDLIDCEILKIDENGSLTPTKINGIEQESAFVRFSVEIIGETIPEVYKNRKVFDCYTDYYISQQKGQSLCYASGKIAACSDKHPSKIRNTADKAKLISSNDTSGYTFRGRLITSDQVAEISYDISQKAHNALRWLISKQGFHCEEQWYIIFENHSQEIIQLNEGTYDLLFKGHTDEPEYFNEIPIAYTGEEYASLIKKYVFLSSKELEPNSNVTIIGLEAATVGRLAVTLYQKLDTSDYFKKVSNWHSTCNWNLFAKITDKSNPKYVKYLNYVGTPSVRDIVDAVCGKNASDAIKKDSFQRLMACIIDGKQIPRDMIFSLSNFASTPYSFENNYSYQKTLQIACALIRKYYNDKNNEEVFTVALNESNTNRDYLFGRILATAQKLEESALYDAGETRQTSAERLHRQFTQKPARTLKIIHDNLEPYIIRMKLAGKNYYSMQLDKILAMMSEEDFNSTASLSPEYLLAYSSQMFAYNNFQKAEAPKETEE